MTIADDVSSARRVHSGRSTREVVVDLGSIAVANICCAPSRSTSVKMSRADCPGNSTSFSLGFVMVAYLLAPLG